MDFHAYRTVSATVPDEQGRKYEGDRQDRMWKTVVVLPQRQEGSLKKRKL